MKKKILSVLSAVLMLTVILTGCKGSTKLEYAYTGSEMSRDPLVICVDIETTDSEDKYFRDRMMLDLINTLEQTAGLKDTAFLLIPHKGNERTTALDRLRIEMMAGGGPDVFLMAHHGSKGNTQTGQVEETENLFEFPQKAMENGMFLPLDTYMENNTKYAEWDKLTQSVLAAGRNDEGQQIIPLKYTLPVIVYEKEQFDYTPNRTLSWHDMLNDPTLSPYALDLANCTDYDYSVYGNDGELPATQYHLEYILGELADFKNEALLFTEEELLARINELLSLDRDDANDVPEDDSRSGVEEMLGSNLSANSYNQPITLIPMYSDDGGVTANISAFAAINRNTKRPEEAFAVLDLLMSKRVQQTNNFFTSPFLLGDLRSFPMHEELFQEDTALSMEGGAYMTPENLKELCEVRGQITGANFAGRTVQILKSLHYDAIRLKEQQTADDLSVKALVHEAYENLEHRVKE
ncbi:MAG: extracellular solute-binding protein [Clostridia bacterium]|nr:extracellular solute-binding protein [Clostridia bacterium]